MTAGEDAKTFYEQLVAAGRERGGLRKVRYSPQSSASAP
jgi:hypothetical protein